MLGKFSFKAYRRTFPLPYQTSGRVWREREGYIVRFDKGDGRFGYGEVAPIPIFGTETLFAARAFLQDFTEDPSIDLPIKNITRGIDEFFSLHGISDLLVNVFEYRALIYN